MTLRIFE